MSICAWVIEFFDRHESLKIQLVILQLRLILQQVALGLLQLLNLKRPGIDFQKKLPFLDHLPFDEG